MGASKHNHWTEVSRLGFVQVQTHVLNKYKSTQLEVEVMNGVGKLLLKVVNRGKVAGEDTFCDSSKVGRSFFELAGMDG